MGFLRGKRSARAIDAPAGMCNASGMCRAPRRVRKWGAKAAHELTIGVAKLGCLGDLGACLKADHDQAAAGRLKREAFTLPTALKIGPILGIGKILCEERP